MLLLFTFVIFLGTTCVEGGYQHRSFLSVLDAIYTCYERYSSLTMLEFGNQEFHDLYQYVEYPLFKRYGYEYGGNASAKLFFNHLGIEHTSIDINGKDGAIAFDVRNDIREVFPGDKTFDIVTNLGFSEHVGEGDVEENFLTNQYSIFKNIHEMGKAGSLFFHDLPAVGGHFQHGVAHYNTSFFRSMARIQRYDLIYLFVTDFGSDWTRTIVASYIKMEDSPFMSFEEFKLLPGLQPIYSDYRILVVPIEIRNENGIPIKEEVIFDTEKMSSTETAVEFCNRVKESLEKIGFGKERCEVELAQLLENRKIEKSIR